MTTELQLYSALLTNIKQRIQQAQVKVAHSISGELIEMYWDIGRMLYERQQEKGWGAAIIPKIAHQMVNELPKVKGFSERNMKRMLRFYKEYALSDDVPSKKVPQLVAQLPWGHNTLLSYVVM